MSETATQAQQPPQQQQARDHATLAALTVLLLAGLPPAATIGLAVPLLAPLGITPAAVRHVFQTLGPYAQLPAPPRTPPPGAAQTWVDATAPARRAAYLLAAAQRQASVDVDTERRYLQQHLNAERARAEAAGRVDTIAALVRGTSAGVPVALGWYSVMDIRTTAGCREMHGRNFLSAQPPRVEGRPAYPGAVHPACRCRPGPPHPQQP